MNNINSIKRCAIYCRAACSSTEANSNNSIEQQEARCRIRITNDVGSNAAITVFNESPASGESMEKRATLMILIKQIEAGKFDRVYVSTLCRLTRDAQDGLNIIYSVFKQANVILVTANNGPFNPFDQTSFIPIALSLMISLAESEKIKHRTQCGVYHHIAEGNYQGPVPYGYEIINKSVIVAEQEANVVREIYQRYGDGESLMNIVQDLQLRGVKKKSRTMSRRNLTDTPLAGPLLNKKMVISMLSNCIYIGYVRTTLHRKMKSAFITPAYEKDGYAYFKSKHPPIITDSQWNRVQSTILELL